ncbi:MAG: hypothetical protein DWQ37_17580 [Planctomycetota bacterium]|nr:MAG: hypothetical protein DWQ37_17580 [Planctomycetota bacterium]
MLTLGGRARPLLAEETPRPKRPKIAALITEFRRNSHAEVIVDRILEGYGWASEHYHPKLDLVAMYVDQFPDADLSRERESRFENLNIYPTIAEALCLGGDQLAVDGVVIIGEHGSYPVNKKGQTLYPRYEFFDQTVDVFRNSGRGVPVFNDKHLSWKWDWARQMVDTADELTFPFMAGSSLPVTWRVPAVEMPLGAEVEEVMSIANGNVDSYDFHALETIQCFVERRKGGECGVVRLQALRGDDVWKAFEAGSWDSGGWNPALLEACLCRSHELAPAREGFNHVYPTFDDMRRMVKEPVAYRFEYGDGLKATMLLLNGLVGDITFAAKLKWQDEPLSTLNYLGGGGTTQPHNFDGLVWYIEKFMHDRKPPYPLARTLLTTGLVAAGVESLWQDSATLDTPHLAIRYQPTGESTYRRA